MQDGNTPLYYAERNGHPKSVEYIQAKMGVTKFDMVCNIDTLFCLSMCIVI